MAGSRVTEAGSLPCWGRTERANCGEFRESLKPWHVPTFSVVFADVDGNIGYQATGRIPLRHRPERGYRAASDSADQWDDLIPFENMPGSHQSAAGLCRDGQQSRRRRQLSLSAFRHLDERTSRASHPRIDRIAGDAQTRRPSTAATGRLLAARGHLLARTVRAARGRRAKRCPTGRRLAARLERGLSPRTCGSGDLQCVFRRLVPTRRRREISGGVGSSPGGGDRRLGGQTTRRAIHPAATARAGSPATIVAVPFARPSAAPSTAWPSDWAQPWRIGLGAGSIDSISSIFLSGRGDLGLLLNQGGAGVRGDATTVCNTGRGPDFEAAVGAGFRMICDLGESPAGLWMVDCQSQSGHCGSPHYRDQFPDWISGEYHFVPLDREEAAKGFKSRLRLISTKADEIRMRSTWTRQEIRISCSPHALDFRGNWRAFWLRFRDGGFLIR